MMMDDGLHASKIYCFSIGDGLLIVESFIGQESQY